MMDNWYCFLGENHASYEKKKKKKKDPCNKSIFNAHVKTEYLVYFYYNYQFWPIKIKLNI